MVADYQTDKAEHHQDSASYHQPMRKLHPGEYLNQATSDRSNLWLRPNRAAKRMGVATVS